MKARAWTGVISKTFRSTKSISADSGSRMTMTTGFPSAQLWVRALKSFTSSAVVRLVVGFEVSVTTASCLAKSWHEPRLIPSKSSSVRQGFILADYACRGNQAIDNRRNGVCDKTKKPFTAENAEKFSEHA